MIRRKRVEVVPLVDYRSEATVNGRTLLPSTEVSIRGERGRFRFMNAQTTSTGKEVLNFVGGASGHEVFRSFYPERVRTVHRINKTRSNNHDS